MTTTRSQVARLIAGAFLAGTATCADGSPTGADAGPLTDLQLAPAFTREAAGIFGQLGEFGFAVNNVHVQLKHFDGTLALDTVVEVAEGQDEVAIRARVRLRRSAERLAAVIEMRDDDLLLFGGTQVIDARGGAGPSRPSDIPLAYQGPAAGATTLLLAPRDTAVTVGDSLALQAVASDADGRTYTLLPLVWSISNPAAGSIDSSGTFRAGGGRGATYAVARLLTGPTDSARLVVSVPATNLVVVSGADQVGVVGEPLAQPIVVEARGDDNLPVPYAALTVSVTAGGGTVPHATLFADATGRASVTPTLGTATGPNAIAIAGSGIPSLNVAAVAGPGVATALDIIQQPPGTTPSGASFASQPAVQLRDRFGNAVTTAGVAITARLASADGRVLNGTVIRATDAAGIARFTDLGISGRVGTTSLTFGQDTIATVRSGDVVVVHGAPATIVHEGGNGSGALPGGLVVLRARVEDDGGNPVPLTMVSFSIASGGGDLPGGTTYATATAGDGAVSADWHLGPSGVQRVRATAGSATLDFGALVAERIVMLQEPSVDPQSGVTIPAQPRVRLRDGQGNDVKVAGAQIVASYERDPANQNLLTTLTGELTAITDSQGVATWTDLTLTGETSPATPQTVKLAFTEATVGAALPTAYSRIMSLRTGPPQVLEPAANDVHALVPPGQSIVPIAVRVTDGLNPVQGVGVTFADAHGTCPLSGTMATSDASGVATVDVTSHPALGSCAIQAQMNVPQPTAGQTVYFRVYVAPGDVAVWTGAASQAWDNATNWLGGQVPAATSAVLIPAGWQSIGLDPVPLLTADTTALASIAIERDASMLLGGKVLRISAGLLAEGPLYGGGSVIATGAGSTLRAGYVQGLLRVDANADYTVNGPLTTDSLAVEGALRLTADDTVTVTGELRTFGAGQLYQSTGRIEASRTTLDGALANLTGGTLATRGPFTHNGDCAHVYQASGEHLTHLFGEFADTVSLTWNATCGSHFAVLDIEVLGTSGVALRTTLPGGTTVPVDQLVIETDAHLTVTAPIALQITPGGFIDISSGAFLYFVGAPPTGLDCAPSAPLAQGDNPGARTCIAIE